MSQKKTSWGNIFSYQHDVIYPKNTSLEAFDFFTKKDCLLPYGSGRSYGDSCLNENHALIDTKNLNHFLAFDKEKGLLTIEAGVTLDEILKVIVPHGFFLPIVPGTKFITVGGAIANDIHGKNHHEAGNFGHHVTSLTLQRSTGRMTCSHAENTDLFKATIGGLGLTGIILSATIKLVKKGPFIDYETIKFHGLEEFFSLSKDSDDKFAFTVAWVDCLGKGKNLARGHFIRGNFAEISHKTPIVHKDPKLMVPCHAPGFFMHKMAIKAFNFTYFHKQLAKEKKGICHYEPFFFPLDKVANWNLIYGKKGFYQYQFVIGLSEKKALLDIFNAISASGLASFLAVLKQFGPIESSGILSFPRPGFTLALDFPANAKGVKELFHTLDDIVLKAKGRLYPAKDSRQPPRVFKESYPNWKDFLPYKDPAFSSSFWRRVTGD